MEQHKVEIYNGMVPPGSTTKFFGKDLLRGLDQVSYRITIADQGQWFLTIGGSRPVKLPDVIWFGGADLRLLAVVYGGCCVYGDPNLAESFCKISDHAMAWATFHEHLIVLDWNKIYVVSPAGKFFSEAHCLSAVNKLYMMHSKKNKLNEFEFEVKGLESGNEVLITYRFCSNGLFVTAKDSD